MSDVAIVIPSMDNRAYLDPCLLSLRLFTRDVDYRVFVVNNGAPASCGWIHDTDSQTVILHANGNVGWERALEMGIAASTEPYLLFLNDDVQFVSRQRDWLSMLVHDLDDPTVAAVGPSSNTVAGPQSITQPLQATRYQARYLIGFCLLVRRSALLEVGGIDTSLPGGDDIDLSIRLRKAGYQLICDRRVFVHHAGFKTGIRLHGPHTRPGGWNSPEMTHAMIAALAAKHGLPAVTHAVRNDPPAEYTATVSGGLLA